tara:strand:- start:362 stop:835 length:474 start_codon:yes stop_codon:yes gene_type:complete
MSGFSLGCGSIEKVWNLADGLLNQAVSLSITAFPNQQYDLIVVLLDSFELMTTRVAEVLKIERRSWVCRDHSDLVSSTQTLDRFSGLENWKRAPQPTRVNQSFCLVHSKSPCYLKLLGQQVNPRLTIQVQIEKAYSIVDNILRARTLFQIHSADILT